MSTFLTSAPAVKKALLELLEKELAAPVQVRYAHPGAEIQQESVYFGRTISHEAAAAMGHRRRDENYDLELVIDVAQDGNDPQKAEERCWELVEKIEEVLGTINSPSNATLETILNGWIVFAGVEITPHILQGQRLAEAICTISVKNRKRVTTP